MPQRADRLPVERDRHADVGQLLAGEICQGRIRIEEVRLAPDQRDDDRLPRSG